MMRLRICLTRRLVVGVSLKTLACVLGESGYWMYVTSYRNIAIRHQLHIQRSHKSARSWKWTYLKKQLISAMKKVCNSRTRYRCFTNKHKTIWKYDLVQASDSIKLMQHSVPPLLGKTRHFQQYLKFPDSFRSSPARANKVHFSSSNFGPACRKSPSFNAANKPFLSSCIDASLVVSFLHLSIVYFWLIALFPLTWWSNLSRIPLLSEQPIPVLTCLSNYVLTL